MGARVLLGAVAGLIALGSGAALAAGGRLSVFSPGEAEGAVPAGLVETRIDDHIVVADEGGVAIRVSRRYVLSCSARDDRRAILRLAVGGVGRTAHWSLEAPVMRLRHHPRVRLPEHLRSGAVLFAAAGGNEASSSEEEATGSLVFERISCRNGPRVRLRVDAQLGSEFHDGARIGVTGSLRAAVSTTR
jgi:hypothetical protein